MSYRARRGYAEAAVETASPTQVLRALYVRLLRDLDEAVEKINANDPGGKGIVLNHAHQICSVLCDALDRAVAPELCAQLGRLYGFVMDSINRANFNMDAKPLIEARRIVVVLQDAFEQAAHGVPVKPMTAAGGEMMPTVEQSLRRLFEATPTPPSEETPLDQLLLQAEIIATERQHILTELAQLVEAGHTLGPREKAMLDEVLALDERWQTRLNEARSRLTETRDRAERPTGRVSGYR